MENFKKLGKGSSWAKHLRNRKKSPFTKQMANKKTRSKSKSSLVAEVKEHTESATTVYKKLKKGLEEVLRLKREGNYHDRDFDSMIDSL